MNCGEHGSSIFRRVVRRATRVVAAAAVISIGLVALPQQMMAEAEAADLNNVQARIASFQAVSPSGAVCIRYTPSGGGFTSAEARVGYGRSGNYCPSGDEVDLSEQSGLGVQVYSTTGVQPGELFRLARITHFNRPIAGMTVDPANRSANLEGSLQVRLGGGASDPTITFPWELQETSNTAGQCPTWQVSSVICDDRVTFTDLDGVEQSASIVDNQGNRYRIKIAQINTNQGGECPDLAPPGGNESTFITQENTSTIGCIFASLEPVRQVTIKKQTDPTGTSQEFDFSVDGKDAAGGDLEDFRLGHGDEHVVDVGGTQNATFTEDVADRWQLSNLTCDTNTGVTIDQGAGSVSIAPEGPDVTCTFTNTRIPWQDLTVEKTAVATYDRDFDWTIEKSVDREQAKVPEGTDATFNYTVKATKSAPKDSNARVRGEITVTNPNTHPVMGVNVTDSLPGGQCLVADGTNLTVPAGESITRSYECALATKPESTITNTATATWDPDNYPESSGTATGTAQVTFGEPANVTDSEVTVTDDQVDLSELPGGNVITESKEFTYPRSIAGVPGQCTTYGNTATLTSDDGQDQTAEQDVEVCVGRDLTVEKNVAGTFTRTYGFDIAKKVDEDSKTVGPDGKATFDYTVTVTPGDFTDSMWAMNGTITIENPNEWQAVEVAVADELDLGSEHTCTIDGGSTVTIPAGESLDVDYSCAFTGKPDNYTGVNTAIVTWDEAQFFTPGNNAKGTAPITEASWNRTDVNRTVEVFDDKTDPDNPVKLGDVEWNEQGTATDFDYSLELKGEEAQCVPYTNTATVRAGGVQIGEPATQDVSVCWPQWTVAKTATPETGSVVKPGDPIDYEIVVTNTGESPVTGAQITDDLSGVVNSANYVLLSLSWSTEGSATILDDAKLQINGDAITGTIDSLGVGESVVITYRVVVKPDAFDRTIRNSVTGSNDFPPEACTEDEPCETEHQTPGRPKLTLAKTVENAHGGDAQADDWTLTATGPTTISGAHGADDVTAAEVNPGEYTLTEGNGPASYSPVSLVCVDADDTELDGVDLANPVVMLQAGDDVTCTFTNREAAWQDLRVEKTAVTSYDRDFDWSITKTVDRERAEIAEGEEAEFAYTVTATKSAAKDSNFAVAGTITVTNPNDRDVSGVMVSDELPGATCEVAAGEDLTVPAGESIQVDYSCELDARPETTLENTATASWDADDFDGSTGTATGNAPVEFGEPTNVTGDSATVRDSQFALDGEEDGVTVTETTSWDYTKEFAGEAGTCTEYDNTASVEADDDQNASADKTVQVCIGRDLTVSKNVTGSFTRTYGFNLDKKVDETRKTVGADGKATFDYTVTVSPGVADDSGWAMNGQITVVNPNDWQDVTVNIADQLNLGQAQNCAITQGAEQTVPAGGQTTVNYVCTFGGRPANYDGANTAIITWDADQFNTPTGEADHEVAISESDWDRSDARRDVEVVDDKTNPDEPIVLGSYRWEADGEPKDFTYPLTLDGTPGECVDFTNTAVLEAAGEPITQPVTADTTVCWPSWTVAKEAEPGTGSTVMPGDDITYTVTVTNTGESPVVNAHISDDLSGVLEHAALDEDSLSWQASGTETQLDSDKLAVNGDVISGVIDELGVGDTVTISYTVTVANDAYAVTLKNLVTGSSDFPPEACTEDEPCFTEHETPGRPKLTLKKLVENNNGGAAQADAWTLTATDSGDAEVVNGTDGVSESVTAGEFTLAEADGPAGYELVSLVCVDGDNEVLDAVDLQNPSVNLVAGDDVTCTFTNRDTPVNLTLHKELNPQWGGVANPTDWTVKAEGPGDAEVSGAGTASGTVPAGEYDLSESGGPAGWTQDGAWVCNDEELDGSTVVLTVGTSMECRVTNTDLPGKLTLVKEVVNEPWAGSAEASDWTLLAAGPTDGVAGATGDDEVTDRNVAAGDYDLSEQGPGGYDASAWVCNDEELDGSIVSVANGQEVECVITNTARPGKLTLVKEVTNTWGGELTAEDFTLTAAGPTDGVEGTTGQESITGRNVVAGVYDLSETNADGYSASDWVCEGGIQDGSSVAVANGDDVTCTITNRDRPAKLTLRKDVENSWNGSRDVEDFELAAAGPTTGVTGFTGDDAVTDREVAAGSYDLSENNPDPIGYGQDGAWVCNDREIDGTTIELTNGQDVDCVIRNVDRPARLTLEKVVDAAESGSQRTPADWILSATPDRIEDQATVTGVGDPDADGGVSQVEIKAGSYDLAEEGPGGFDAGEWVCEGAPIVDGQVQIANGANVHCQITNTAVAPKLTLIKEVDNGDTGGTAKPKDWTLVADGPSPVSGTVGDPQVTDVAVMVGDYTLSEAGGPSGYSASAWVCEGAEVTDGGTISLAEGDNVVCTITNTAQTPEWTYTKTSDPVSGSAVAAGDEITYTITARHTGGVPATDVVIDDDLAEVNAHAKLLTEDFGSEDVEVAGDRLRWKVGTLIGERTLSYTVRVNVDAQDTTIKNVVVGSGHTPPDPCLDDEPDCRETEHPVPPTPWTLTKSSNPVTGSTVNPGDVVTYTLTAKPTGEEAPRKVVVTDDLSGVLDHAMLINDSFAPADAKVDVDGGKLIWTIGKLSAETSLSYQVKVNDDAAGVTIRNVVTGDGVRPPEPCEPPAETVAAMGRIAAAVAGNSELPEWCRTTTHEVPDPEPPVDPPTDPPVDPPVAPPVDPPSRPRIPTVGGPAGAWLLGGLVALAMGVAVTMTTRRRRSE